MCVCVCVSVDACVCVCVCRCIWTWLGCIFGLEFGVVCLELRSCGCELYVVFWFGVVCGVGSRWKGKGKESSMEWYGEVAGQAV